MGTNLNQKISPEGYWIALANSKLIPNFWMTQEYAELAELEWCQEGELWGWKEPDQPGWFLPPMDKDCFRIDQPTWAGFPDEKGSIESLILDRQYIYDARDFLNLEGSQWKVYRKNINKYPRREKGILEYRRLEEDKYEDEIVKLLTVWSEDKVGKGQPLHNIEVMAKFFLWGKHRWGLFRNGILVGVNVGDENISYALYRYCVDDGTPFLNEYLRHCFYTSHWVQGRRWVNDGGDLGNQSLERFKRKLNPAIVQTVYSYVLR